MLLSADTRHLVEFGIGVSLPVAVLFFLAAGVTVVVAKAKGYQLQLPWTRRTPAHAAGPAPTHAAGPAPRHAYINPAADVDQRASVVTSSDSSTYDYIRDEDVASLTAIVTARPALALQDH